MDTQPSSRRYCLISPCRNEATYASRTIESVSGQTIVPDLWVIVDDGSTDDTPKILDEYARRYSFIKVIRRPDRGCRRVGRGVIEAFNEGLSAVNLNDFEFICKLDLDLVLPPTYFEALIRRMDDDPRLGTCSGKPYFFADGRMHDEVCGDENSVGMTKFYRRNCFEQIGGFVSEVMWDGIDCHRCRMLGWKAASLTDPELRFEHLRPMGSSQKDIWHGRMRHGAGQYFMGTGPIYMVASALYRIGSRPRIIGSVAMLWGYLLAAMRGAPRYGDKDFDRFLHRFQWNSLVLGKRRAVEKLDTSNEVVWRRSQGVLHDAVMRRDTERIWIKDNEGIPAQGNYHAPSDKPFHKSELTQVRSR
jgi:glycosyltransferase involved in cell wall biosynthesis